MISKTYDRVVIKRAISVFLKGLAEPQAHKQIESSFLKDTIGNQLLSCIVHSLVPQDFNKISLLEYSRSQRIDVQHQRSGAGQVLKRHSCFKLTQRGGCFTTA